MLFFADIGRSADCQRVSVRHGVAGSECDCLSAEKALAGNALQASAGQQAVLPELLLAGPHGHGRH